jgi:hypothetical protein
MKTATDRKSSRKPTNKKTDENQLHLNFYKRDEYEKLIFATSVLEFDILRTVHRDIFV